MRPAGMRIPLCRKAGVPEEVVFKTKPEIALARITAAHEAGIAPGVVLADAGYGNSLIPNISAASNWLNSRARTRSKTLSNFRIRRSCRHVCRHIVPHAKGAQANPDRSCATYSGHIMC